MKAYKTTAISHFHLKNQWIYDIHSGKAKTNFYPKCVSHKTHLITPKLEHDWRQTFMYANYIFKFQSFFHVTEKSRKQKFTVCKPRLVEAWCLVLLTPVADQIQHHVSVFYTQVSSHRFRLATCGYSSFT